MNRALRIGDRVEFRDLHEADLLCRSAAYPELLGCEAGQPWDEASDKRMTVAARHDAVQAASSQLSIDGPAQVHRSRRLARPMVEVELSWAGKRALVFAGLMRLDTRARRNRAAAKVEAMKARRCAERRRKTK